LPGTATIPKSATKVGLTKLSVAELQAMYREVVRRETRSSDSAYLVWKLRQAQRGKVRVGPHRQSCTASMLMPSSGVLLRHCSWSAPRVVPPEMRNPEKLAPLGVRFNVGSAALRRLEDGSVSGT
jgi:hypothetical protein